MPQDACCPADTAAPAEGARLAEEVVHRPFSACRGVAKISRRQTSGAPATQVRLTVSGCATWGRAVSVYSAKARAPQDAGLRSLWEDGGDSEQPGSSRSDCGS